jgi:hypothetical protein
VWETPPALFAALDQEFHFTADVAALPDNAKCACFYTPEQDSIQQPWEGGCWMNPPYGPLLRQWVRKAYESAQTGAVVSAYSRRARIRTGGMSMSCPMPRSAICGDACSFTAAATPRPSLRSLSFFAP